LETDGTHSLQEISREVAPEFQLEGCSRMLRSARDWQWWDGTLQSIRIPEILVKKPNQIRPRYERPWIPNEYETEIPLLTNRRSAILLDAPLMDSKYSRHEMIASYNLTPLEILLLKEQSEEDQERERRIGEWNHWVARRNSAFACPSSSKS